MIVFRLYNECGTREVINFVSEDMLIVRIPDAAVCKVKLAEDADYAALKAPLACALCGASSDSPR